MADAGYRVRVPCAWLMRYPKAGHPKCIADGVRLVYYGGGEDMFCRPHAQAVEARFAAHNDSQEAGRG